MSRPSHPCSTTNDAPPYAVPSAPHSLKPSTHVLTLVWKPACPIRIIQEELWQFCHFKVIPAHIFDMLCPSHVIVNSAPFFQTQSNTVYLCWVNVRPFSTKPQYHFLSAVRYWLFNTVAATLSIWGYLRIIWDKPGLELLCEGINEAKVYVMKVKLDYKLTMYMLMQIISRFIKLNACTQ